MLRNKKDTTTGSPGTRSNASTEVHLVTGGGGFPGFSLGKRLAGCGHRVILFDVKEPIWTVREGMEFVKVSRFNFISIKCFFAVQQTVFDHNKAKGDINQHA